jgi:Na+-driven multidrug efflux pump
VNFPIAFILSRFTSAGVLWIFLAVQLGTLAECLVGFVLVRRGVWLRNIVSG